MSPGGPYNTEESSIIICQGVVSESSFINSVFIVSTISVTNSCFNYCLNYHVISLRCKKTTKNKSDKTLMRTVYLVIWENYAYYMSACNDTYRKSRGSSQSSVSFLTLCTLTENKITWAYLARRCSPKPQTRQQNKTAKHKSHLTFDPLEPISPIGPC